MQNINIINFNIIKEKINMKRLKIDLDILKRNNGRTIALPTIVFTIDTGDKEFGFSIACLWYVFSIQYYYGKSLDC